MFSKSFIITLLAVGALAQLPTPQLSEDQIKETSGRVKEYCKKNGAEDKYPELESGIREFIECIKGLVNVGQLKDEIEAAKPNGALDEVFKKYCDKSPQLKTCIHKVMAAVTPCVDKKVQEHLPAANNATDQLIDFVCYKDGDRIALFIAEGGPECFREKATEIQDCGKKLKDSVNENELQSLSLDDSCIKFDEGTTCIVKALEGCSTPTPANMAESLFKFVRKGSPCKKN